MFPGDPLEDPHEGGDEAVDVARVVLAGCLENHDRAKQLLDGSGRCPGDDNDCFGKSLAMPITTK